jgi:DNA repair protein RecN (Recombination protein N)
MLKHLAIKNFAIIENVEIDFDAGFNVLIGETGAGKSIIIDALQILLGEKAPSSFIREGASKSIIEGFFSFHKNHNIWQLLSENEIELFEEISNQIELIIRREINANSSSRTFVNDAPAQLNLVKEIGDLIVDFHGQYSHQLLLNPKNHIQVLDSYCNNYNFLNNYQNVFNKYHSTKKQYNEFITNKNKQLSILIQKKADLALIQEISPKANEDKELLDEVKILESADLLFNQYTEIANLLYESDFSVLNNLAQIGKKLSTIVKVNAAVANFATDIHSSNSALVELASHTKDYLDNFAYNPQRIEEINQRLFLINNLKRKFGTIEEILVYQKELLEFVENNEDFEKVEKKILLDLKNIKEELIEKAEILSESRFKVFEHFQDEIKLILLKLGFSSVEFKIENDKPLNYNEASFTKIGIDKIEFFISTNKGESPKPLSQIASGGEISRIMLALKSLAANDANLPMLVFDEIDSGVSGAISFKIGEQIRKLSQNHQVVAITHSPQITAASKKAFSIKKIENESRTFSIVVELDENELINEIAKFTSGENLTPESIENSKKLRLLGK